MTQNEGMTGEWGMVHKDVQDYGMNCAVPWGVFTVGSVVLIELENNVEVRGVYEFIFRGGYIAHKRDAAEGVRGLLTSSLTRMCWTSEKSKRAGREGLNKL